MLFFSQGSYDYYSRYLILLQLYSILPAFTYHLYPWYSYCLTLTVILFLTFFNFTFFLDNSSLKVLWSFHLVLIYLLCPIGYFNSLTLSLSIGFIILIYPYFTLFSFFSHLSHWSYLLSTFFRHNCWPFGHSYNWTYN